MVDLSAGCLRTAIEAAHSDGQLVALSQAIWQHLATNALDPGEAEALSMLLDGRRKALRGPQAVSSQRRGRPSIFPSKRRQRSPDRAKSLMRRRTLAASGPLPPMLAARHTTGELAVLKIVADEVQARGACELYVDAIAARAGVSASTTRNAIRSARRQGLLHVEERPREGMRNDTNRITITDGSWLAWIAKGQRVQRGGFKMLSPTDKKILSIVKPCAHEKANKGCRDQRAASSGPPHPRF